MDFFDVVNKRKAIRKYIDKTVSDDLINKILETINLAPSAGNLQSFKILIIKNKNKISKISEICNNQEFIKEVSVVFIFLVKPKEAGQRYGQRGEVLYAVQDATIAATYAILTSASLGLATCWVGAFDKDILKKELNTELLPVCIIPLGYANENPGRKPRKKITEISEIIQ
jgi:nitroreductase